MATTVEVELTGDEAVFRRTARRLTHGEPVFRQVGVFVTMRALERLNATITTDPHTGKLGHSIAPREVTDEHVTVVADTKYAAIRQLGGTIEPKTGKMLAIPLSQRLRRQELWPRDIDPQRKVLRVIPSKSGDKAVLIDEEGELGYGKKPLYVLVPRVVIPARPYLIVDDEDAEAIETMFIDFIERPGQAGEAVG